MIFSAFISSSRGSNICRNLYIHHFRDLYYACDSDYYDDDDNDNVISLSQSLVPLKYFAKTSKQFLFYCLIIKLKFFYQGRGREKLHDLLGCHPLLSPSSSIYRVGIVDLKSPWILGGVLEKSLNSIFPWKVFKFLCNSLKCPWIFFSSESSGLQSVFLTMLFGYPRQDTNSSSEKLKILQKNVKELVEETVQALKSCEDGLWICTFVRQPVKLHNYRWSLKSS